MQLDLDPARLVFIDETWASTNMARRYGRAPRGERLRAAIPHGYWKTTTFVAGLRLGGVVAPLVFDGPINAQVFEAWVEQFLVPTLLPANLVVMDNLSSYKGPRVRAMIEAAGATLSYLPPYSQPRLQSHRNDVLQAEGPPPQGRRANNRRLVGHPCRLHPSRDATRMRQLFRGRLV